MVSLHNKIMNIQDHVNKYQYGDPLLRKVYKEGHRDARHEGAELSLKYESALEEAYGALLKMSQGKPVTNLDEILLQCKNLGL